MMVSNWLESKVLPTTLTLKNIPDELYERLKSAAELNRRSLNSEAIVCLESGLRIVDVPDSANCGCPGFRGFRPGFRSADCARIEPGQA